MMEATATMAMIPITTPSTVSSDRALCWRRESKAMRVFSPISNCTVATSRTCFLCVPSCPLWLTNYKWSNHEGYKGDLAPNQSLSFKPQRLDGIQFRGPVCRIQAEKQSHCGRYRQR